MRRSATALIQELHRVPEGQEPPEALQLVLENSSHVIEPGVQVGELLVEKLTYSRHTENSPPQKQWLCRCACGRQARRTDAGLKRALKVGVSPCCHHCRAELLAGYRITKRAQRSDTLLTWWRLHGTLFEPPVDDRMFEDLVEDFEAAGMAFVDRLPEAAYQPAACMEECRGPGQLGAYLHHIHDENLGGWRCIDCDRPFTTGYGCVLCIEPVCSRCVTAEAHRCHNPQYFNNEVRAYTLQEIGDIEGISREWVRGIMDRALGKLRHASRAKELEEFYERDDRKVYEKERELRLLDAVRDLREQRFKKSRKELLRKKVRDLCGEAQPLMPVVAERLSVEELAAQPHAVLQRLAIMEGMELTAFNTLSMRDQARTLLNSMNTQRAKR